MQLLFHVKLKSHVRVILQVINLVVSNGKSQHNQ